VATVQQVYRHLLQDEIAPALRELGLAGYGRIFEFDSDDAWGRLGFRTSTADDGAIRFTVDICVVSKLVWDSAQRAQPTRHDQPEPGVYNGKFVWDRRIGLLMPDPADLWWRVDLGTDIGSMAADVIAAIRDFGLPAARAQL
jgi:hypothetical protein